MTKKWILGAGTVFLGAAMLTRVAAAQQPPSLIQEDANAGVTRDQLNRVFEQYPPNLRFVVQLDNSLLNNKEFLTPYPRLGGFVTQHPEVLRNPSFYVGGGERLAVEYRGGRSDVAGDIMAPLAVVAVLVTLIVSVGWIIRSVIDHRRWLRISRIQSETHTKLLDRFTSSQDLLAYIQTPSARRFLESAPISIQSGDLIGAGAPVGRILLSVQAGVVLAFGGAGLLYGSRILGAEVAQPFHILGVLGVAVGVGFILSALASYLISRSMGLVRSTSEAEPTAPPT